MIFKSYILEQDINIIKSYKMFMFYGENLGLKKEFKKKLKIFHNKTEVLNLFQEEIIKDKNILINEIRNKSLFDEKKIIFINEANDKLYDIIESIGSEITEEKVFVFSDILDKKSKLRSYFESSKVFGVTACYKDNEITLRKFIMEKLNGFKGLNQNLINMIIGNSSLDRNKIINEIDKIKSCFKDKVIDGNKIESLLNIKTNEDFNLLKDEALKGNKQKTNRLLADTIFDDQQVFYYLNAINQRICKLNEIEKLKNNNSNIETLISNLKPPIFWKDRPVLTDQAKKWNTVKIKIALNKIYETEIKIKTDSSIRKDLLIKKLVVDLCQSANAS